MKYTIETGKITKCGECFCVSLDESYGTYYTCKHPEIIKSDKCDIVYEDELPRWCPLEGD